MLSGGYDLHLRCNNSLRSDEAHEYQPTQHFNGYDRAATFASARKAGWTLIPTKDRAFCPDCQSYVCPDCRGYGDLELSREPCSDTLVTCDTCQGRGLVPPCHP